MSQLNNPQNTYLDKYVVVGNPIAHSLSPTIHADFAAQTQQNMVYERMLVPLGEFNSSMQQFFNEGGKGCNVTVPFKLDAYQFASQVTQRAKLAGAVNTLLKLEDGSILGDNTDGEGLVQDLVNHKVYLKGKTILVIGAGGATQGVLFPLLQQDPKYIHITNRTFNKASMLANRFSAYGNIQAIEMEVVKSSYDVIINATSASLSNHLPQISRSIFNSDSIVYDMAYSSGLTCFNSWAKENGVQSIFDGLGMLVAQAGESFFLWRNIKPHTKHILAKLKEQN